MWLITLMLLSNVNNVIKPDGNMDGMLPCNRVCNEKCLRQLQPVHLRIIRFNYGIFCVIFCQLGKKGVLGTPSVYLGSKASNIDYDSQHY